MEDGNLVKSFAPIVNDDSIILIIGSLPGNKSIEVNEYYANTRNQFWSILSTVYENKIIEFENYSDKKQFLNTHHIALWDIYFETKRVGSSDHSIENGRYNNITQLLNKYLNIKLVLVNGKKAEKALKKQLKDTNLNIQYKYVPSSSCANTKYTFAEKVKEWKNAIKN